MKINSKSHHSDLTEKQQQRNKQQNAQKFPAIFFCLIEYYGFGNHESLRKSLGLLSLQGRRIRGAGGPCPPPQLFADHLTLLRATPKIFKSSFGPALYAHSCIKMKSLSALKTCAK